MRENNILYNAAAIALAASQVIRPIDDEFANILLNKAQEYKDKIEIDAQLNKEVTELAKEIGKGL